MKYPITLMTIIALLLVGCAPAPEPKTEFVTGTVVQEYQEPSKWGCVATDWNTVVRFDDNRVVKLCGRWGGLGAKVAGCYETGHMDRSLDGFRLVCGKKEN